MFNLKSFPRSALASALALTFSANAFSAGANAYVQTNLVANDFAGQPQEFFVQGPATNFSNGSTYGNDAGAAKFIFVTQDGTINAWRTKTDPGMVEAVVVKDYSEASSIVPGTQTPDSAAPASTVWP